MRIGRIGIGVLVLALSAGCNKQMEAAEDAGANTAHAESAVGDHPVHENSGPAPTEQVRVRDGGTEMNSAAARDSGVATNSVASTDAGAVAPLVNAKPAEVEISGTLIDSPKDADLRVFVNRTPCDKNAMPTNAFTSVGVKNGGKNSHFETEIFVPQGSVSFVCAYASKAGKIVGYSAWPKQLVMKGEGEVVFADILLPLNKR